MTIQDIAFKINDYINENSVLLSKFQQYRRKAKGKKKGIDDFFSPQTTFEKYAYHYGGRSELQYNIGVEGELFRYGIAFSLEPSQSYPEPEIALSEKITKYNEYISVNYLRYIDYHMWCWTSENKSNSHDLTKIPEEWIKRGNFIFIGIYLDKDFRQIDNSDIAKIVQSFERLFSIYKKVELIEKRMAKLCWNSEGWIKPSGISGKSKDNNSYENVNQFGHEEWLFDFEKLIDGFHYGAIQPVGKNQDKYSNRFFDIKLYTYNAETKSWFWIGEIQEVQALSTEEAQKIYAHYDSIGWLDTMKAELQNIGAVDTELDNYTQFTFNVKFKPRDVVLYDNGLIPFQEGERITHTRYTLLNTDQVVFREKENAEISIVHGNEMSPNRNIITRTFSGDTREYTFLHGKIQDSFLNYLKEKFPEEKISKEASIVGLNRKIDIYQVRPDNSSVLYEVKSYTETIQSARVAIGQLLEYAYYPNRNKSVKLIIVSHKMIDSRTKEYISNLNDLFNFDLGMIGYDFDEDMIIDSVNCAFMM